MTASVRLSIWLVPILAAAMMGVGCWDVQSVGAASTVYYPAYLELIPTELPKLFVFPTMAPKVAVPLPAGLPTDLRLIDFSHDGTAIYVQRLGEWDGIIKIEFKPARQSIVRGSVGVGTIGSLVVSQKPERILVSGVAKSHGKVECGIFEIDPDGGEFRQLLDGQFPDCGGFISPDGKRVLRLARIPSDPRAGTHLSLLDLRTGAIQPLGDGLSWAQWSPNGRWIAAILNYHRIVLIDSADTSRRRDLGRTDDNQAFWSPDSKYLLLAKGELLCGGELSTLEAVDILTGKRSRIKNSHCNILATTLGWVDSEVVQ